MGPTTKSLFSIALGLNLIEKLIRFSLFYSLFNFTAPLSYAVLIISGAVRLPNNTLSTKGKPKKRSRCFDWRGAGELAGRRTQKKPGSSPGPFAVMASARTHRLCAGL